MRLSGAQHSAPARACCHPRSPCILSRCMAMSTHQHCCAANVSFVHARMPHRPAWGPGAEQEGRQAYAARRQEAQMREQIEMVLEQQRGCLQAGTWAARQAPREARQVPPPVAGCGRQRLLVEQSTAMWELSRNCLDNRDAARPSSGPHVHPWVKLETGAAKPQCSLILSPELLAELLAAQAGAAVQAPALQRPGEPGPDPARCGCCGRSCLWHRRVPVHLGCTPLSSCCMPALRPCVQGWRDLGFRF